jgi:hypothetical protein
MTTIKVLGCGGRYSSVKFFPCHLCDLKNSDYKCRTILANVGYQQKHEEYHRIKKIETRRTIYHKLLW